MAVPYHIAFVVEQSLGHKTYGQNLRAKINAHDHIEPRWILPEWQKGELAGKLPVYRSNWTVQAGWQARRGLKKLEKKFCLDGLFFHTQVPAVLASDWVSRYPSIISLDATPIQYDHLGGAYAHGRGPDWLEKMKLDLNRRCFRAADHLVTWTKWAKDGLVADYSVPADKITVISPGVDVQTWSRPDVLYPKNGTIKILFVGGDLERKGGKMLIEAFQTLRAQGNIQEKLELHLVTQKKIPEEQGIHLHLGLVPNSTELISLYQQADIFCLPTNGDCLPMVLAEAGAAGLPIISTRVGGIPEIVREGENGYLIDPADTRELVETMERLVCNRQLREEMGRQSHQIISTAHDTAQNANRIAEVLCQVIENSPKRKKSV